jgi:short-subunit dehydrogenase
MKNVVLVGATDGIGGALAEAFLDRSSRVAVLGRDPHKLDALVSSLQRGRPEGCVTGVQLDVTAPAQAVERALNEAVVGLGQMDLIVYCAGMSAEGDTTLEDVFAVNTIGAIRVLEWAAQYLSRRGAGRIAAIGSVAGDRGRAGAPVYAASKAALHQYLEGLRNRLHPVGVGVTTIKPGWVRTRMLGAVPSFPPSVTAERAARSIARALLAGRDAFYVPWWWGIVSLGLRLTPRFLYKRLAPP